MFVVLGYLKVNPVRMLLLMSTMSILLSDASAQGSVAPAKKGAYPS